MALFDSQLNVVNLGLASFGDAIRDSGAKVTQLEWRPPAEGDTQAALSLARLLEHPKVEEANATAYERYQNAQPRLVDVQLAKDAIPAMADQRLLLHSGPPIAWADMCGPQQGALIGAILFEGWADDPQQAEAMAADGEVAFAPCHHHDAVGPMAGVISPSMPLWVVENAAGTNRAFSNFNEGLGKVLRFGAYSDEVLTRLRWMGTELYQCMQAAVRDLGGLELKPMIAQSLHMGDEAHNRPVAGTGLLYKKLMPSLLGADLPLDVIRRGAEFIAGNDHFFLNLSMAASKAMLDAGAGVPHSTLVIAMARNGVNFGIRLSGTGERWFQAPARPVDGLFFPGYGIDDAAADLGDSAITETAGLGGFAMAASPAIVQFVGGSPRDAMAHSRRMRDITLGTNSVFSLPALDFSGSAAGIDIRRVADTGILPIINSGIAHKKAGVGQIGAGITSAPMGCFTEALTALAEDLGEDT